MAERGGEAPPQPLPAAALRQDDILDEATRKDLFTSTFCKLCRIVLQFRSQRRSHYKGKKHAKNVHLYIQACGKDEKQEHDKQKRTDCIGFQMDRSGVVDKNKHCNLCNLCFTSPQIHTKKLKQLSGDQAHVLAQRTQPVPALQKPSAEKPLLPSTAEESLLSSNTRLKLNESDKYCKLCCAPFNNPVAAQAHYDGKRHRRNEARKKILEELGDKGVPAEFCINAVGVGYYMCAMCNVTLTCIATYQSHMNGKKHQINLCRERMLVSHRKKSEKTCVSIQGEFTDSIKVQEARGLVLRRYLGKAEEEKFQDRTIKGRSDLGEVIPSNFKCEQGQCSSLFSETQSPTNTGENTSANWPLTCDHALGDCHHNKVYCKEEREEQVSEVATIRDKSCSLSAAESESCYELVLAETSTSFYRKEQKFQIKRFEEEKYISEELKYEKGATKQKRKKNSDGADFITENEKQKRIKFEVDLVNEKKPSPYKGKRLKGNPTRKARSRKRIKRSHRQMAKEKRSYFGLNLPWDIDKGFA